MKGKTRIPNALILLILVINFSAILAQQPASGDRDTLALRPPMGWNSYDCFGSMVTEEEVRENAKYMALNLKNAGFEYIVIDFCWSYPFQPKALFGNYPQLKLDYNLGYTPWLAMDEYGRLLPDPWRFPSSAGDRGFKPLADYVHSLGLKFGIHVMRGIPRQAVWDRSSIKGTSGIDASMIADTTSECPWLNQMWGINMTKPGAQEYYNSLLDLYASWDVDFIKVDDISRPYNSPEIEAVHRAIEQCGRPVVLSLSPGRTPLGKAEHVASMANMWRISDDFWDDWSRLKEQFTLCNNWAPYIRPGHWPDADMLPVGTLSLRGPAGKVRTTRFTRDEQFTMISLWSMFRSPLMIGGNMPEFDPFTLGLLSNNEILEIDRNSVNNHVVYDRDGVIIWRADSPDGMAAFVAVFNTTDVDMEDAMVRWDDLGLKSSRYDIRDLWDRRDLGSFKNEITMKVPAHGVRMLKFIK